jgi:circadian clock protein KaiC
MVEEIIRTKTGIQDLDKALNGGIPQGNVVLVSGGAGTGKSTLCLQFAVNGASLFGEKSLYLSTEQNKKELFKQADGFGWNLADLESKQLLKLVYFDITAGDSFLEKIHSLVQEFQPKRIVIDSLTTLTDSMLVSDVLDEKSFSMVKVAETVSPIPRSEKAISKTLLYYLFKEIKQYDVTALLTTELPEEQKQLSADGISEFIADGVLTMHYLGIGATESRSLQIRKMRYSGHEMGVLPYDISDAGVKMIAEEEIKF